MAWNKEITQEKIDGINNLEQIIVGLIQALNQGKKTKAQLEAAIGKGVRFPAHLYRDSFCRISALKYLRSCLFHFNLTQVNVMTAKDVWEIWDRGYRGCAKYMIKTGTKEEKAKGQLALQS